MNLENTLMTDRPNNALRSTPRVYLLIVACLIMVLSGFAVPLRGPGTPAVAAAQQPQTAGVLPRGNVEHGQYLAEHVAMCVECHSGRDERGNLLDDRKYRGGLVPFSPPWPNDWATIIPPNRGLPGYSDAQALRLLTQGAIGRDGKQLRPPMPRFRMTVQDAADLIAFLRSVP
jgi:hypothetical protein